MTDVSIRLTLDNSAFVTGMGRASGSLSGFGSQSERAAAASERLSGAVARVGHYAVALAGISGFAQIVSGTVRLADEFATLNGRMSLVIDSAGKVAETQRKIFNIAQETGTSVSGLSETFVKLTQSTAGTGISQERLLGITKTMGQTMALSGGSADSMKAALIQLGQGMASGTLRGEELNSVIEQTPALAKAIADGLGISIGELRKWGEEGRISSRMIAVALENSAAEVEQNFGKLPLTVGRAMTTMQNSLLQAVGTFDQANGLSNKLATGINFLANNLDVLAAAGAGLTTMMVGRMVPGMYAGVAAVLAERAAKIASLQATVASTEARAIYTGMVHAEAAATLASARGLGASIVAQNAATASGAAHTAALAAQTVAQTALAKATSITSLAMSALGGPIGLVTTAISLGVTAWMMWGNKSAEATKQAGQAIEETYPELLAKLKKENDLLERKLMLQAKTKLMIDEANPLEVRRLELLGQYNDLSASAAPTAEADLARREKLRSVTTELAGVTVELERATELKTQADNKGGKVAAELMSIRNKLNGVDENYVKTLGRLGEMRKAGHLTDEAYSDLVQQLAAKQNKLDDSTKKLAGTQEKQTESVSKLIGELSDKLSIGNIEIVQQSKLTDGQKLAYGVMEKLRDGVIKGTDAERRHIASLLEGIIAQETSTREADEAAKARERVIKLAGELTTAELNAADAVWKEVAAAKEHNATIGKTQEQLRALERAKLDDALATAEQTLQQALKAPTDAATLDAITLQVEGLRELKKLKDEGVIQAATVETAKEAADAWQKTSDQIGQGLTDSLFRAFESGKGFFSTLWAGIVNTFKTTVLRLSVDAIMKGSGLSGLLAGAGGAAADSGAAGGAMGNAGSLLGMAGSLGGAIGAYGGLASAGMGMTLAGNAGAAFGAAGAAIGNGSMLAGAAVGMGAALPFIGAALAVYALYQKFKGDAGTPHTGGAGFADELGSGATSWANVAGKGAWIASAKNTEDSSIATSKLIASMLNTLGDLTDKKTNFRVSTGFADDTSKDGAWGALNISSSAGKVVDWKDTQTSKWAPKVFADGEAGFKEYVAALATSTRTAIDSIKLPEWAASIMSSLGGAPTLDQLAQTVEQITTVAREIASVGAALEPMGGAFANVAKLSGDATLELASFVGGLEALVTKSKGFVSSFYSEGEQAAITATGIVSALGAVGINTDFDGKAEYRALVDSINVGTTVGRQQFAALLNVANDFAGLTEYMKSSGLSLQEIAKGMPALNVLDKVAEAAAVDSEAPAGKTQEELSTELVANGTELLMSNRESVTQLTTMNASLAAINTNILALQTALAAGLTEVGDVFASGLANVAEQTRATARIIQSWDDGGAMITTAAP